ncbi:mitochondrial outer membrane import complex protein METAXIN-like [Cornus florida]|uniref:mitochondrial outer membrane import complex protein METAXIN-like n=1 Tax=Cornus florida TaxID=4283 RepID=UPI00289B6FE0|nr:mitochondrial outer membrane import complex protein METAXIN-like [Cornus florida]
MDEVNNRELTLVTRKPCFGLPTACPSCLPVYIYLRFAKVPFNLDYNLIHPDSDQIPYVESGVYVAYNNEKGGVIESLREDGIVDLDSEVHAIPEWLSMKAMINSWLADAIMYELWVGSDGSSAHKIYYSDLPWPIGKFLYFKQTRVAKQQLGITKENAERREEEIYRRATIAYGALSTRLGERSFFFEDRPTSLDAVFLGHVLFTLQALPETSVLRSKLLERNNLVQYAEKLQMSFLEAGSSSSIPHVRSDPSSYAPKRGPSNWSSKPKSKPKREKTEEEKTFRRRAKYFLLTQLVAVLVFLSLVSGSDDTEVELDDDEYDD